MEITSTQGLIYVSPKYAERHPEATVEINGKFYRPSVSAEQALEYQKAGFSSNEMYADKMRKIKSGELIYKTGVGFAYNIERELAPVQVAFESLRADYDILREKMNIMTGGRGVAFSPATYEECGTFDLSSGALAGLGIMGRHQAEYHSLAEQADLMWEQLQLLNLYLGIRRGKKAGEITTEMEQAIKDVIAGG